MAVVLSALVTGFPIWKGLVIFNMTGNKRPADGEGMMKPADAEGPPDAEELVVICYKHQY